MLRLYSEITIYKQPSFTEELKYSYCTEVELEDSWDTLTDGGMVIFPRKATTIEKQIVNGADAIFSVGDKITIKLGYYPNLETAFTGYISSININIPLEIKVEDEMFILKKTQAKAFTGKEGNNLTIKKLLTAILPKGMRFVAQDRNIGDWRLTGNNSVATVLDELRTKHAVYSYFKDGVLNCGFPSDIASQKTGTFHFEKNIINCKSLNYQLAKDIKTKIKVNLFYSNNENGQVVEVGDSDGDLRTINLYNVPKADAENSANEALKRVKYDGYKGSFTTFGEPFMSSGDVVKLVSDVIPERDGLYLIKSVRRSFGMDGYRQEIEIETKIS